MATWSAASGSATGAVQRVSLGRTLTDKGIAHYQRIVVAIKETIRLMGQIDQTIESHGGLAD